ncbi:hypothetical protein NFI96_012247 [Prochilodus magdalenae]|nr:hypothetical protein NFI96_012247 [Prochilodus magdalenae]
MMQGLMMQGVMMQGLMMQGSTMSQEDAGGDPLTHSDPSVFEAPSEEHAPVPAPNTDEPPSAPPLSLATPEPEPTSEGGEVHFPATQAEETPQGQSVGGPGDQVTECSESVSLEPDAAEGEMEASEHSPSKGWGGWGSWGKSLLNSATSTVGESLQLCHHINLTGALYVEKAGVGLAGSGRSLLQCEGGSSGGRRKEHPEAESTEPDQTGETDGSAVQSGATPKGVLSSITSAVQNTGKSVLTGGLDALEFIGKKTMTVLAESDPGFKKTKTLMQRTVSLSQNSCTQKEVWECGGVGKEDKDAEGSERERAARKSEQSDGVLNPLPHYSILFDDTKAFADGEEFVSVLTELLFELHVAATPDKLNKARVKAYDWVKEVEKPTATDVAKEATEEASKDGSAPFTTHALEEGAGKHEEESEKEVEKGNADSSSTGKLESVYLSSVGSLAEVTARSIEQLHKVAELILHGQDVEKPAAQQAKILVQVGPVPCARRWGCLSRRFF